MMKVLPFLSEGWLLNMSDEDFQEIRRKRAEHRKSAAAANKKSSGTEVLTGKKPEPKRK